MTPERFIKPYLKNCKIQWYALPVLGACAILFPLLAPWIQARFIDALTQKTSGVWFFFLLVLCCQGATYFFATLQQYIGGQVEIRVSTALKSGLVWKLLDLPGDFFYRHGSGHLTAKIEIETARMSYFYSMRRWQTILLLISLFPAWGFLFAGNCWVALSVLPLIPIYYLTARVFFKRNYELAQKSNRASAEGYGVLHNVFKNIRLVKSHGNENTAGRQVTDQYSKIRELGKKSLNLNLMASGLFRFIPSVFKLALLIVGIVLIQKGQWTLGELWAQLGYASLLFNPIQAVAGLLMERSAACAAAEQVTALSERLPEPNLEHGFMPEKLKGKVEFQNICFSYEVNKPVLNHLTFTAEPGDRVGVFGSSGSGKSTLMSLILQLYRPDSGNILLDDRPAETYHLRELRKKIAYVSQDLQFQPDTLQNNISTEASREDICNTLLALGADSLIPRLDELLQEDGNNFSGGEKLRIATARELLRHADLFLLDEPTNGLDREHAGILMTHLSRALSGRTVFLITHDENLKSWCSKTILLNPDQNESITGNAGEF